MKARKRFGQHFLHDQQIIEKIIRAIAPQEHDWIVEIGPGLGALTLPLLQRIKKLTAIEFDRDLIQPLRTATAAIGELQLFQADALKFDFNSLNQSQLRIVGNLPYNISTPLLFHLLEYLPRIKDMHFMLQKEVAERIAANPGTADYGPLSIMVQYHCRVEVLFLIGPRAFNPPPKVDSAMLRLKPHSPPAIAQDLSKLRLIVRTAFSKRRKMLHNSLRELITPDQLMTLNIDPNTRPEQLTVADFVKISNIYNESDNKP